MVAAERRRVQQVGCIPCDRAVGLHTWSSILSTEDYKLPCPQAVPYRHNLESTSARPSTQTEEAGIGGPRLLAANVITR